MDDGLPDGAINFFLDEVAESLLVLIWMCLNERFHTGSNMVFDHNVCGELEVLDLDFLSILRKLDVCDRVV